MTSIRFRTTMMMASALAAGLFVSALLYHPHWEQERIWSGAQPPDMTATERHFMLHFMPKYRWEDCLVLVEYQFDGPREEYYQYSLSRLIPIYLYAHETRTLIASGMDSGPVGDTGQFYLIYADECSRRYEITESAARYIEERDPRFKLTVSPEPVSTSDLRFRSSGFWIDDPDHNPDYWRLKNKAMRGDGGAFLRMAEINKEGGDFVAAFRNYGLAAEFLPEGRARDLSVIGREESRDLLTPDKQAIVDEGLRQSIKLVRSLVKSLEAGR